MASPPARRPSGRETVNQVLEQRLRRGGPRQQAPFWAFSLVVHGVIVAAAWLVPDLFAEPPKTFDSVAVTVVPPAVLGSQDEPTATPPEEKPTPEPPPSEPTPPPPPDPAPGPVLPQEEPKPRQPPPPPPRQTTPPSQQQPSARPTTAPPKRRGSPFGNPLGAATDEAIIGVEDPNFTYGYYVNRVVALISQTWDRPPVGSEFVQAVINFDILADGTVTRVELVESSGSAVFDDQARRAVEAASPMPPLPKKYAQGSDHLGIHLIIR